ncbi:MAG: hypothetical protein HY327_08705 [Chloroflexi bacterium]|nr:hypothetical protein [Chloroflexota bacterium]
MKTYLLAILLTLTLAACSPAAVTAPAPETNLSVKAAPTVSVTPSAPESNLSVKAAPTVVDLKKITYDRKTPATVLEEGRMLFIAKMRSREPIQWNQLIKDLITDEALIVWAIDKTSQANLSPAEAEKVIRYFLAFRYTSYGADPCE